jgi:hypothetical protein
MGSARLILLRRAGDRGESGWPSPSRSPLPLSSEVYSSPARILRIAQ